MTIGSGALVRSPIMSCSICANSMSITGSAFVTLARTSAITSSVARVAVGLQFDARYRRGWLP